MLNDSQDLFLQQLLDVTGLNDFTLSLLLLLLHTVEEVVGLQHSAQ